MLVFDSLSLFPEMLYGFISCSMIGRAVDNHLLSVNLHNIRDWTSDKHRLTDDSPFGGGSGMVMKPEPIFSAVQSLKKHDSHVVYMCPDGVPLTTSIAQDLAQKQHIIVISGHYEGIDERIRESVVDQEISIGDYVLTNGNLATAVLIDAVARHIPGVLGGEYSLMQDSFSDGLLSFPQYTRPECFNGMRVPNVLLSGNHAEIAKWRHQQRVSRTMSRRPDLIKEGTLK